MASVPTRLRILILAVAVGALLAPSLVGSPRDDAGGEVTTIGGKAREEPDGQEGERGERREERQEQQAATTERLEALRAARAAGTLGRTETIRRNVSRPWDGERLFNATTDDWEPALAADPGSPYVYILTTRYGARRACPLICPSPAIMLRVSDDHGQTFADEQFLCRCPRVSAQYDPEIEVAADGSVYASWMNEFNVVFSRSTDHGSTWTKPVSVHGALAWSDKPILAISQTGKDVYIAFNRSHSYVSRSHDFGRTWRGPVRTNNSLRYYFAGGGYVAPDGTVTFAETNYAQTSIGPVKVLAISSHDGGETWDDTVIDTVEQQPPCTSEGCPTDFYGPQGAIAGDAHGNLVMLYQGATVAEGPQTMYARRSTDGGASWGPRVAISPPGANAAFPAAVGRGNGEVRAWFMDDRTGRWNVWFRRSSDLGLTWTSAVRISDAFRGTVYKHPNGFDEAYGDYGEIGIGSDGRTHAVWGEGISYTGPGGTWYNRTDP